MHKAAELESKTTRTRSREAEGLLNEHKMPSATSRARDLADLPGKNDTERQF